jgi:hypothetical protein
LHGKRHFDREQVVGGHQFIAALAAGWISASCLMTLLRALKASAAVARISLGVIRILAG